MIRLQTIDAHAAGEPLRLIVDGFPAPQGKTMLEKREIEIPAKDGPALLLGKELANMGTWVGERGRVRIGRLGDEHDDLVIACALGCWRARWKAQSMWGRRSLGLG